MTKRIPRRDALLVDMLRTPDDGKDEPPQPWRGFSNRSRRRDVSDLIERWPEITRKGEALVYRENCRRLGRELGSLPRTFRFTEQEMTALFVIASRLMETPESDSTRRDERDFKVAADYILHTEFMSHSAYVMTKLCARWDISKATATKAITRHRESARGYVKERLEGHRLALRLANEDPKLFAEKVRADYDRTKTAEQQVEEELKAFAIVYRVGSGGLMRPRRRRKPRD